LQPTTLPYGKVAVLESQVWKGRRAAENKRFIKSDKLLFQHPHRPPIAYDVVHRHDEDMFFVSQLQKFYAQHGTARQVEWRVDFSLGNLRNFLLAFDSWDMAQINFLHTEVALREHFLNGHPISLGKACSQDFMTADDLLKRSPKSVLLQLADHSQCNGHVVRSTPWLKLIQEQ
jgi:hypothetical protein